MTENKGDLISREALKEDFDVAFFEDEDDYKKALRIIDNAPTVEPEKPPCNQIAWEQGYEAGLEQGKRKREQGEWIKDNSGDRFCSECGSCALYHEIGLKIESRFCPNCGAKMKGSAEE